MSCFPVRERNETSENLTEPHEMIVKGSVKKGLVKFLLPSLILLPEGEITEHEFEHPGECLFRNFLAPAAVLTTISCPVCFCSVFLRIAAAGIRHWLMPFFYCRFHSYIVTA